MLARLSFQSGNLMQIRPATLADVPGIARVHVDSWRTTYRGMVPDDYLDNLSYERRATYWTEELSRPDNPHFAVVAGADDGEIVGFASGGPERHGDPVYTGELYAIYLLAQSQREGGGRALVHAVAARLALAGHPAMLLWVLSGNPARRFYERLGGQPLQVKTLILGGAELEEVAYGWPDIRVLIND